LTLLCKEKNPKELPDNDRAKEKTKIPGYFYLKPGKIKKLSGHNGTDDRDILDGAVFWISRHFTNLINHVHTFNNLTKDRMHGVKVVVIVKVDEELASSGIWAGVCHRNRTSVIPVVYRELIFDNIPGATLAGAGWVTSLDHEAINDPVENNTVVKTFLHERFKVACSDRHGRIERNGDITHGRLEFYQF